MKLGKQPKLTVTVDKDSNLHLDSWQLELMRAIEKEYKWKLVRERDGLTKESEKIMWIEFNQEGRFKEKFDEIAVGRSLLMSPFNMFFTWQTTTVTEVIADREDYKEFKTGNSHYRLFKLSQDVE